MSPAEERVPSGGERPMWVPPLASEDHLCQPCGIRYSTVTVDGALEAVAAAPRQLRMEVSATPGDCLHLRPEPATWSVAEYVCHLRDVLAATTLRLHRTRTEDNPTVDPILNDVRADRFGYNRRELPPLLDEIGDMADGVLREAARFSPEDWDRTHHRYSDEKRSAQWIIRQAMHEVVHHLRDISQVAASVRSRP